MTSIVLQAMRRQAQLCLPQVLQPALNLSLSSQHGQAPLISNWQPPLISSCTCYGSKRLFSSLNIQQVEQLRKELSRPAQSLSFQRPGPDTMPSIVSHPMLNKLILNVGMYWSDKNQAILGGQVLYDAIKEQVDDGALCTAFGMDPKVFYSTYTLLAIHAWLIIQRLASRNGKTDRFFKQRFYNQFQADVEKRIYAAGVQIGVTKWLKKLETVFYSSALSFDRVLRDDDTEGEERGQSGTAGASQAKKPNSRDVAGRLELVVLREFFGGDSSKVLQAELITRYLLHQMQCLKITDEADILKGNIQFSREPFEGYRTRIAAAPSGAMGGAQQPQTG